ncbi:hypothetical protein [Methanoculleus bourgensis]|uniref:hypothetical protein n=1 Tax=Methanoculleus bourgensis TaxID=83986 RepID=UPI0022EF725A|nr:hypothetical protein [Methanoculleus bourgensis]GLI46877.1 hypothetical protein MBOURGENBZM_16690 [Methanoculleus bourgensis]
MSGFWAWVAGWGFVVGKLASCSAVALTFGYYLSPDCARYLAAGAVIAFVALNYFGIEKTAGATKIIVAVVLLADLRAAIGFSSFTVLLYYAVTNISAYTLTEQERLYSRTSRCLVFWAVLRSRSRCRPHQSAPGVRSCWRAYWFTSCRGGASREDGSPVRRCGSCRNRPVHLAGDCEPNPSRL